VPLTTLSGTGFAGIETSVMGQFRLGAKGVKSRAGRSKSAYFASS
jgi:hypothetical protein